MTKNLLHEQSLESNIKLSVVTNQINYKNFWSGDLIGKVNFSIVNFKNTFFI